MRAPISIETVRKAMTWMDITVYPRPMPQVRWLAPGDTSLACYNIKEHVIRLPYQASITTWAHEMCHSQQPHGTGSGSYRRADGSVDPDRWLACPREQEAMAAEVIAPAMLRDDWDLMREGVEAADIRGMDRATAVIWLLAGRIDAVKRMCLARKQRKRLVATFRAIYCAPTM